MSALFTKSLSEIGELLRNGDLTALDLLDTILERIGDLDGRVMSYSAINRSAQKEAEKADTLFRSGRKTGDLLGIPVSVKDLIDTAGIRTSYGNCLYSSNIPAVDAPMVSSLLSAGSYVLGKTNTHEFALGMVTPPTSNPYDLERIPGGSSGGSAAAVASGLAVFALGTDTGGSIRIPASMCGVTGLKPTYGILPLQGVFPESWSLDHGGPILRHASDIPLAMKAMGHPLPGTAKKGKLRAGILEENFSRSEKEVEALARKAVQELEDHGLIETVNFSSEAIKESGRLHPVVDTSEIAAVHKERLESNPNAFLASSVDQIKQGLATGAVDYIRAVRARNGIYENFAKGMKGIDVLLSPTLPHTAPKKTDMEKKSGDGFSYLGFQMEYNYLGVPALSIPCGLSNGLPVGLQIIGRRYEDSTAVHLAEKFQEITDHHMKMPKIAYT